MAEQSTGEVRDEKDKLQSGGDGVTFNSVEELDRSAGEVRDEKDHQKVGDEGGVTLDRSRSLNDAKKQEAINPLKNVEYSPKRCRFGIHYSESNGTVESDLEFGRDTSRLDNHFAVTPLGGVTLGRSRSLDDAKKQEAIAPFPKLDFLAVRGHLRSSNVHQHGTVESDLEFGRDTSRLDYFAVTPLSPYKGEDHSGIGGGSGTRQSVLGKTFNLQGPGAGAGAGAASKRSLFSDWLQWWKKKVSTEVDRPVE